MDEENIESLINEAIDDHNIKIQDIYQSGLNVGMSEVLRKHKENIYDLSEVIVCADVLNKGIDFLKNYGDITNDINFKILLSVVSGDTHEIDKNILKIMLKATGYDVLDIGVNVDNKTIIRESIKNSVDIICLSSMMTTTRGEMQKLINELNSMKIKNKLMVLVGGSSITKEFANKIGSDGYASNAPLAVELIKKILKEKI